MADQAGQRDSMQRLGELIAKLDEVQREIQALTQDKVDAVVLPDGLPFLLSGAQTALRDHEQQQREHAAQLAGIIDALPAKMVLLDDSGEIVATNAAWRNERPDGSPLPVTDSGDNYLEICDRVEGPDADTAAASAAGIREVLAGDGSRFSMEYECGAPGGDTRWYRLLAAPLPADTGPQVVVMHIDVTMEHRARVYARREERYFRQLFDSSPVPMWLYDRKTLRFLEVNRAAIRQYGYSRSRFLEMTIRDIRPTEEVTRLDSHLASVPLAAHHSGTWKHRRADGAVIDVEIASDVLDVEEGDARLVAAIDVSERMRIRRSKEAESRVLSAISNREPLGRILGLVAAALEQAAPGMLASVLLLTPDGRRIRQTVAPSLSQEFMRAIEAMDIGPDADPCGIAIHQGEHVSVEDIRSSPLWAGLSDLAGQMGLRAAWSLPILDSGRQVVGSLALYYREARTPAPWERELAESFASLAGLAVERQRQDEALETSERRLRKLFREAATGIVVVTEAGDFEQANGVFARFIGCAESELRALNYHDLTHPADREEVLTAMRSLLSGASQAETLEHRFVPVGGSEAWGRVRLSPQSGHDGRPSRLIGIIEDTTLRKHAELQLERATALQRIAGRIGRVGGWSLDLEKDQVFWSPEIFDILEWGDERIPPLSETLNLYPSEDRVRVESAIRRCHEAAMPFDLEAEIETFNGRRLQVRVAGEPESGPDGRVARVIGVFQDITGQKRAEAQRAELASRLENVLENMSDAFMLVDADWNITYINRACERELASSRDSLLGQTIWDAFPEARETMIREQYQHAVETGTSVHFEFFYAPLDDWFEINAYPSPEGLAIYFRVITEQRRMQEQLHQAQRMESVGQLTGGIAHDFNNLLTVILGNAELLVEYLEDSEGLEPIARNIGEAATRGAELTRRLLAFARRQPLEPEPTDVNRLIRDLEELLRRALGEQCEIEISHGAALWPAMIDGSRFENALLNLAINARDAMPDGGRLTIETGNVRIDDEYSRHHPDVVPGQYVLVAVSDTGTGIPKEMIDKVFEPFFTTKEKGRGTGLGLSMVYGFIKQSEGHVRVYSEAGEGTTVRLYLPRAPVEATVPREPELHSETSRGETVMVVEDESSVRDLAAGALVQLGYRVCSASSGREALDLLEQDVECDLLFTDVVMPGGMSGPELAEAAKKLRPGLKVLYTSGYTENAIVHQGRLEPGVHLLSKPYRRDELARRVRRVLDDGSTAEGGHEDG